MSFDIKPDELDALLSEVNVPVVRSAHPKPHCPAYCKPFHVCPLSFSRCFEEHVHHAPGECPVCADD